MTTRALVDERFSRIVEIRRALHARPELSFEEHATTALVREQLRALGAPASDDVSEFLRRVPGCFFFVGAARRDETSGMHHSPTFAIDEEALSTGMVVMADGAVALAEE